MNPALSVVQRTTSQDTTTVMVIVSVANTGKQEMIWNNGSTEHLKMPKWSH